MTSAGRLSSNAKDVGGASQGEFGATTKFLSDSRRGDINIVQHEFKNAAESSKTGGKLSDGVDPDSRPPEPEVPTRDAREREPSGIQFANGDSRGKSADR